MSVSTTTGSPFKSNDFDLPTSANSLPSGDLAQDSHSQQKPSTPDLPQSLNPKIYQDLLSGGGESRKEVVLDLSNILKPDGYFKTGPIRENATDRIRASLEERLNQFRAESKPLELKTFLSEKFLSGSELPLLPATQRKALLKDLGLAFPQKALAKRFAAWNTPEKRMAHYLHLKAWQSFVGHWEAGGNVFGQFHVGSAEKALPFLEAAVALNPDQPVLVLEYLNLQLQSAEQGNAPQEIYEQVLQTLVFCMEDEAFQKCIEKTPLDSILTEGFQNYASEKCLGEARELTQELKGLQDSKKQAQLQAITGCYESALFFAVNPEKLALELGAFYESQGQKLAALQAYSQAALGNQDSKATLATCLKLYQDIFSDYATLKGLEFDGKLATPQGIALLQTLSQAQQVVGLLINQGVLNDEVLKSLHKEKQLRSYQFDEGADVYYLLGKLLAERGQLKEAGQALSASQFYYEKSLSLDKANNDPQVITTYRELAKVSESLFHVEFSQGKEKAAETALNRAELAYRQASECQLSRVSLKGGKTLPNYTHLVQDRKERRITVDRGNGEVDYQYFSSELPGNLSDYNYIPSRAHEGKHYASWADQGLRAFQERIQEWNDEGQPQQYALPQSPELVDESGEVLESGEVASSDSQGFHYQVDTAKQVLGQWVSIFHQDAKGHFDPKQLEAKDEQEFLSTFFAQFEADNVAYNSMILDSVQSVLMEKEENGDYCYAKLFSIFRHAQDPKAPLPQLKPGEVQDLVKDLTVRLAEVDEESFVNHQVGSEEGRKLLKALISDPELSKDFRANLLEELAEVGKARGWLSRAGYQEFNRHLRTDAIDFDITDEELKAATKIGVRILHTGDSEETETHRQENVYLEHPEEVQALRHGSLPASKVNAESIQATAEYQQAKLKSLQENPEDNAVMTELQASLAGARLAVLDNKNWRVNQEGVRAYILLGIDGLLEESEQIQTQAQFEAFNERLHDFLQGQATPDSYEWWNAIKDWGQENLDFQLGSQTVMSVVHSEMLGGSGELEHLKELSDGYWALAEEDELGGVFGPSLTNQSDPQLSKAISFWDKKILDAKRDLLSSYKRSNLVNRAIQSTSGAIGIGELGYVDTKAELKAGSAFLDQIRQELGQVKSQADFEAIRSKLQTGLKANGVLHRAYGSVDADAWQQLAQIAQSIGEFALMEAVVAVGGGAVAVGRVGFGATKAALRGRSLAKGLSYLRKLRAVRKGQRAAIAAKININPAKNYRAPKQISKGKVNKSVKGSKVNTKPGISKGINLKQAPKAKAIEAPTKLSLSDRFRLALLNRHGDGLRMFKVMAAHTATDNLLEKATGQLRDGDSALSWIKDALATGTSGLVFGGLAAGGLGGASRNVVKNVFKRYFSSFRGFVTNVSRDGLSEVAEELSDAQLRNALDGEFRVMGLRELRDIVFTSFFGEMGAAKEAFKGGGKRKSQSSTSSKSRVSSHLEEEDQGEGFPEVGELVSALSLVGAVSNEQGSQINPAIIAAQESLATSPALESKSPARLASEELTTESSQQPSSIELQNVDLDKTAANDNAVETPQSSGAWQVAAGVAAFFGISSLSNPAEAAVRNVERTITTAPGMLESLLNTSSVTASITLTASILAVGALYSIATKQISLSELRRGIDSLGEWISNQASGFPKIFGFLSTNSDSNSQSNPNQSQDQSDNDFDQGSISIFTNPISISPARIAMAAAASFVTALALGASPMVLGSLAMAGMLGMAVTTSNSKGNNLEALGLAGLKTEDPKALRKRASQLRESAAELAETDDNGRAANKLKQARKLEQQAWKLENLKQHGILLNNLEELSVSKTAELAKKISNPKTRYKKPQAKLSKEEKWAIQFAEALEIEAVRRSEIMRARKADYNAKARVDELMQKHTKATGHRKAQLLTRLRVAYQALIQTNNAELKQMSWEDKAEAFARLLLNLPKAKAGQMHEFIFYVSDQEQGPLITALNKHPQIKGKTTIDSVSFAAAISLVIKDGKGTPPVVIHLKEPRSDANKPIFVQLEGKKEVAVALHEYLEKPAPVVEPTPAEQPKKPDQPSQLPPLPRRTTPSTPFEIVIKDFSRILKQEDDKDTTRDLIIHVPSEEVEANFLKAVNELGISFKVAGGKAKIDYQKPAGAMLSIEIRVDDCNEPYIEEPLGEALPIPLRKKLPEQSAEPAATPQDSSLQPKRSEKPTWRPPEDRAELDLDPIRSILPDGEQEGLRRIEPHLRRLKEFIDSSEATLTIPLTSDADALTFRNLFYKNNPHRQVILGVFGETITILLSSNTREATGLNIGIGATRRKVKFVILKSDEGITDEGAFPFYNGASVPPMAERHDAPVGSVPDYLKPSTPPAPERPLSPPPPPYDEDDVETTHHHAMAGANVQELDLEDDTTVNREDMPSEHPNTDDHDSDATNRRIDPAFELPSFLGGDDGDDAGNPNDIATRVAIPAQRSHAEDADQDVEEEVSGDGDLSVSVVEAIAAISRYAKALPEEVSVAIKAALIAGTPATPPSSAGGVPSALAGAVIAPAAQAHDSTSPDPDAFGSPISDSDAPLRQVPQVADAENNDDGDDDVEALDLDDVELLEDDDATPPSNEVQPGQYPLDADEDGATSLENTRYARMSVILGEGTQPSSVPPSDEGARFSPYDAQVWDDQVPGEDESNGRPTLARIERKSGPALDGYPQPNNTTIANRVKFPDSRDTVDDSPGIASVSLFDDVDDVDDRDRTTPLTGSNITPYTAIVGEATDPTAQQPAEVETQVDSEPPTEAFVPGRVPILPGEPAGVASDQRTTTFMGDRPGATAQENDADPDSEKGRATLAKAGTAQRRPPPLPTRSADDTAKHRQGRPLPPPRNLPATPPAPQASDSGATEPAPSSNRPFYTQPAPPPSGPANIFNDSYSGVTPAPATGQANKGFTPTYDLDTISTDGGTLVSRENEQHDSGQASPPPASPPVSVEAARDETIKPGETAHPDDTAPHAAMADNGTVIIDSTDLQSAPSGDTIVPDTLDDDAAVQTTPTPLSALFALTPQATIQNFRQVLNMIRQDKTVDQNTKHPGAKFHFDSADDYKTFLALLAAEAGIKTNRDNTADLKNQFPGTKVKAFQLTLTDSNGNPKGTMSLTLSYPFKTKTQQTFDDILAAWNPRSNQTVDILVKDEDEHAELMGYIIPQVRILGGNNIDQGDTGEILTITFPNRPGKLTLNIVYQTQTATTDSKLPGEVVAPDSHVPPLPTQSQPATRPATPTSEPESLAVLPPPPEGVAAADQATDWFDSAFEEAQENRDVDFGEVEIIFGSKADHDQALGYVRGSLRNLQRNKQITENDYVIYPNGTKTTIELKFPKGGGFTCYLKFPEELAATGTPPASAPVRRPPPPRPIPATPTPTPTAQLPQPSGEHGHLAKGAKQALQETLGNAVKRARQDGVKSDFIIHPISLISELSRLILESRIAQEVEGKKEHGLALSRSTLIITTPQGKFYLDLAIPDSSNPDQSDSDPLTVKEATKTLIKKLADPITNGDSSSKHIEDLKITLQSESARKAFIAKFKESIEQQPDAGFAVEEPTHVFTLGQTGVRVALDIHTDTTPLTAEAALEKLPFIIQEVRHASDSNQPTQYSEVMIFTDDSERQKFHQAARSHQAASDPQARVAPNIEIPGIADGIGMFINFTDGSSKQIRLELPTQKERDTEIGFPAFSDPNPGRVSPTPPSVSGPQPTQKPPASGKKGSGSGSIFDAGGLLFGAVFLGQMGVVGKILSTLAVLTSGLSVLTTLTGATRKNDADDSASPDSTGERPTIPQIATPLSLAEASELIQNTIQAAHSHQDANPDLVYSEVAIPLHSQQDLLAITDYINRIVKLYTDQGCRAKNMTLLKDKSGILFDLQLPGGKGTIQYKITVAAPQTNDSSTTAPTATPSAQEMGLAIALGQKIDWAKVALRSALTWITSNAVPALNSLWDSFTSLVKSAIKTQAPTIYGIDHDGSEGEKTKVFELLKQASQDGLTRVGLEISPGLLEDRFRSNIFKEYAQFAQQLGMQVIPLESDEGAMRRLVSNHVTSYINQDGKFDRQKLLSDYEQAKSQLAFSKKKLEKAMGWAPPEHLLEYEGLKWQLKFFEGIVAFLESIQYDLDQYAQAHQEINETGAQQEMEEAIRGQKPQIVIIGNAHAEHLSQSSDYDHNNLDIDKEVKEGIPESWREFLVKNLGRQNIKELHAFDKAYISYLYLKRFLAEQLELEGIPEGQLVQVLQEAFEQDENLPALVLRFYMQEDPVCIDLLIPIFDIEFLKLSTSEAGHRIQQALTASPSLPQPTPTPTQPAATQAKRPPLPPKRSAAFQDKKSFAMKEMKMAAEGWEDYQNNDKVSLEITLDSPEEINRMKEELEEAVLGNRISQSFEEAMFHAEAGKQPNEVRLEVGFKNGKTVIYQLKLASEDLLEADDEQAIPPTEPGDATAPSAKTDPTAPVEPEPPTQSRPSLPPVISLPNMEGQDDLVIEELEAASKGEGIYQSHAEVILEIALNSPEEMQTMKAAIRRAAFERNAPSHVLTGSQPNEVQLELEFENGKKVICQLKVASEAAPETASQTSPITQGPILYGIAHDGSEGEKTAVFELLQRAAQDGVTRVGLEISPGLLEDRFRSNIFKTYAQFAQQLGMQVIPLESDEGALQHLVIINDIKLYINQEGKFDRAALHSDRDRAELSLAELERRLQGSPSPEVRAKHGEWKRTLQRLEAGIAFLESIQYDLDQYAQAFERIVAGGVEKEMVETIRRENPQIVIMGAAHARQISKASGYEQNNLGLDKEFKEGIPEAWRVFLDEKFKGRTTNREHSAFNKAYISYPYLKRFLAEQLRRGEIPEGQLTKILQDAFEQNENLSALVLRFYSPEDMTCFSFLVPMFDIEVLKLSTSEANRRIKQALQASPALPPATATSTQPSATQAKSTINSLPPETVAKLKAEVTTQNFEDQRSFIMSELEMADKGEGDYRDNDEITLEIPLDSLGQIQLMREELKYAALRKGATAYELSNNQPNESIIQVEFLDFSQAPAKTIRKLIYRLSVASEAASEADNNQAVQQPPASPTADPQEVQQRITQLVHTAALQAIQKSSSDADTESIPVEVTLDTAEIFNNPAYKRYTIEINFNVSRVDGRITLDEAFKTGVTRAREEVQKSNDEDPAFLLDILLSFDVLLGLDNTTIAVDDQAAPPTEPDPSERTTPIPPTEPQEPAPAAVADDSTQPAADQTTPVTPTPTEPPAIPLSFNPQESEIETNIDEDYLPPSLADIIKAIQRDLGKARSGEEIPSGDYFFSLSSGQDYADLLLYFDQLSKDPAQVQAGFKILEFTQLANGVWLKIQPCDDKEAIDYLIALEALDSRAAVSHFYNSWEQALQNTPSDLNNRTIPIVLFDKQQLEEVRDHIERHVYHFQAKTRAEAKAKQGALIKDIATKDEHGTIVIQIRLPEKKGIVSYQLSHLPENPMRKVGTAPHSADEIIADVEALALEEEALALGKPARHIATPQAELDHKQAVLKRLQNASPATPAPDKNALAVRPLVVPSGPEMGLRVLVGQTFDWAAAAFRNAWTWLVENTGPALKNIKDDITSRVSSAVDRLRTALTKPEPPTLPPAQPVTPPPPVQTSPAPKPKLGMQMQNLTPRSAQEIFNDIMGLAADVFSKPEADTKTLHKAHYRATFHHEYLELLNKIKEWEQQLRAAGYDEDQIKIEENFGSQYIVISLANSHDIAITVETLKEYTTPDTPLSYNQAFDTIIQTLKQLQDQEASIMLPMQSPDDGDELISLVTIRFVDFQKYKIEGGQVPGPLIITTPQGKQLYVYLTIGTPTSPSSPWAQPQNTPPPSPKEDSRSALPPPSPQAEPSSTSNDATTIFNKIMGLVNDISGQPLPKNNTDGVHKKHYQAADRQEVAILRNKIRLLGERLQQEHRGRVEMKKGSVIITLYNKHQIVITIDAPKQPNPIFKALGDALAAARNKWGGKTNAVDPLTGGLLLSVAGQQIGWPFYVGGGLLLGMGFWGSFMELIGLGKKAQPNPAPAAPKATPKRDPNPKPPPRQPAWKAAGVTANQDNGGPLPGTRTTQGMTFDDVKTFMDSFPNRDALKNDLEKCLKGKLTIDALVEGKLDPRVRIVILNAMAYSNLSEEKRLRGKGLLNDRTPLDYRLGTYPEEQRFHALRLLAQGTPSPIPPARHSSQPPANAGAAILRDVKGKSITFTPQPDGSFDFQDSLGNLISFHQDEQGQWLMTDRRDPKQVAKLGRASQLSQSAYSHGKEMPHRINDKPIQVGVPMPIKDGDRVRLGWDFYWFNFFQVTPFEHALDASTYTVTASQRIVTAAHAGELKSIIEEIGLRGWKEVCDNIDACLQGKKTTHVLPQLVRKRMLDLMEQTTLGMLATNQLTGQEQQIINSLAKTSPLFGTNAKERLYHATRQWIVLKQAIAQARSIEDIKSLITNSYIQFSGVSHEELMTRIDDYLRTWESSALNRIPTMLDLQARLAQIAPPIR